MNPAGIDVLIGPEPYVEHGSDRRRHAFGDYALAVILSVINIGVLMLGRLVHKDDAPPGEDDGES